MADRGDAQVGQQYKRRKIKMTKGSSSQSAGLEEVQQQGSPGRILRPRSLRPRVPTPRGDMQIGDEEAVDTSSDDDVEDETFHISPRAGKGPVGDDSSSGEPEEEEAQPEIQPEAGGAMPAAGGAAGGQGVGAAQAPVMAIPSGPRRRVVTNYLKRGMLEEIREERRRDPRSVPRNAFDWRFHTLFQQDFYQSVLMAKSDPVADAQFVDWQYMAKKNDAIFDQVISACDRQKVKKIMGFRHDWNNEIICQFYATVYFDDRSESEDRWQLVWLTEGAIYSVSYPEFSQLLGLGRQDRLRPKLHSEQCLPESELGFMYLPNCQGDYGSTTNLYTFYAYLNRLFRKTIVPRVGDASNLSAYMRNILARMRDGAAPFSVTNFVWEEIRSIAYNPQKSCAFAPILMLMIESSTGVTFVKDVVHRPLQIQRTRHPLVPCGQSEEPPSQEAPAHTRGEPARPSFDERRQDRGRSTSPVQKFFSALIGMFKCFQDKRRKDKAVANERAREQREMHNRLKDIQRALHTEPSPSPNREFVPEPDSDPEIFTSPEDALTHYAAYGGYQHSVPPQFEQHGPPPQSDQQGTTFQFGGSSTGGFVGVSSASQYSQPPPPPDTSVSIAEAAAQSLFGFAGYTTSTGPSYSTDPYGAGSSQSGAQGSGSGWPQWPGQS